jgi:L-amino acid N-acyltransferase YncA
MTGGKLPVALRAAEPGDFAAIHDIYRHHVLNGLASFEVEPPDRVELERRHADVRARNLPYLVALSDGRLIGYAYAGPFRTRPAYRFTVEDSIYIAPDAIGRGVGRALLGALIERCSALDLRQMIAVIGDSGNQGSIALHRALGFGQPFVLEGAGFKFGRWVDIVLMQRPLGPGAGAPPSPGL